MGVKLSTEKLQPVNPSGGRYREVTKHKVEAIPIQLSQSCLAKDNDQASHCDGQLIQTNNIKF